MTSALACRYKEFVEDSTAMAVEFLVAGIAISKISESEESPSRNVKTTQLENTWEMTTFTFASFSSP